MTVIKGDFHALVENTVFNRLTHKQVLQTYFFKCTKLNEKHLTLRNVSYLQNNVNFYIDTLVLLSDPLNLTVEKCIFRENDIHPLFTLNKCSLHFIHVRLGKRPLDEILAVVSPYGLISCSVGLGNHSNSITNIGKVNE